MRKKLLNNIVGLLYAIAIVVGLPLACSMPSVQTTENVALQIVAQRIGFNLAKNNPSIVPQVKLAAQGILSGNTADLQKMALQAGITALTFQFPGDPLLAADIQLIESGLNLSLPDVTLTTAQITPLVNAFIAGLDVGVK